MFDQTSEHGRYLILDLLYQLVIGLDESGYHKLTWRLDRRLRNTADNGSERLMIET